jgi:hypothetical protein
MPPIIGSGAARRLLIRWPGWHSPVCLLSGIKPHARPIMRSERRGRRRRVRRAVTLCFPSPEPAVALTLLPTAQDLPHHLKLSRTLRSPS